MYKVSRINLYIQSTFGARRDLAGPRVLDFGKVRASIKMSMDTRAVHIINGDSNLDAAALPQVHC